jgi:hypothetical protein
MSAERLSFLQRFDRRSATKGLFAVAVPPLFSAPAAPERMKSDVDVQNRNNGRRVGLRHGSYRVSYIYSDRDFSCGRESRGIWRHGRCKRQHS